MSDTHKYYYLKLKDNFYDKPEIKAIESITGGYEYICIMQKMYLRSLSRNGKLMLTDTIPYKPEVLAGVLGHRVEVITAAIEIFRQFNLLEILDDQTIYMTEIQNFIGKSSSEGDRKRLARQEIENHKKLLSGQMSGQMSDNHPPEIEREIKKEIYNTETKKEDDKEIKQEEKRKPEAIDSKKNGRIKKEKKEPFDFATDSVLSILALYPSFCPVKGSPLSPNSLSNRRSVFGLTKKYGLELMTEAHLSLVSALEKSGRWFPTYSGFLNNLLPGELERLKSAKILNVGIDKEVSPAHTDIYLMIKAQVEPENYEKAAEANKFILSEAEYKELKFGGKNE